MTSGRSVGDPLVAEDVLKRIAQVLRLEVGPAVEDDYLRTQAFMAAVVLGKLSKQVAAAAANAAADAADLTELTRTLADLVPADASDVARQAFDTMGTPEDFTSLGPLIGALHRTRGEQAEAALLTVRAVLRRQLDRRMEYAE
jgi:hypothetical protein